MWVLLVFFPIVGIIYMWIAKKEFTQQKKVVFTIVFGVWFLFIGLVNSDDSSVSTISDSSVKETIEENLHSEIIDSDDNLHNEIIDSEIKLSSEIIDNEEDLTGKVINSEKSLTGEMINSEENPDSEITDSKNNQTGEVLAGEDNQELPTSEPESQNEASTNNAAMNSGNADSSDTDESSNSGNGNSFNTYNNAEQQQTSDTYVLNTNTMKIHRPSCYSVKKIAPGNYSTSNLSIEELEAQGYSRCGNCF